MIIFQCKAERIKQYLKQFWAKADQSWSLHHVWSSGYPVGTNPKKEVTNSVRRCFNTFMRVCGQFIVTGISKAVRLADFWSVISRVSLTHSLNTGFYNIPLLRALWVELAKGHADLPDLWKNNVVLYVEKLVFLPFKII